jgi:hypothetical protein
VFPCPASRRARSPLLAVGHLPPRRAARRHRRLRAHPSALDQLSASQASLRCKSRRKLCLLAVDRVGSPEFPRASPLTGGFPVAGAPPPRRSRPPPSALDRAVQIAFDPGSNRSIPVNPPCCTSRRSQPLDLDPADQIRSPTLTAPFLQ